jgi:hypothetical protein
MGAVERGRADLCVVSVRAIERSASYSIRGSGSIAGGIARAEYQSRNAVWR